MGGGSGGPVPPSLSGTLSPPGGVPGQTGGGGSQGVEGSGSSSSGNENLNLKNIGKFFRRDLGGFGGRFGRSGDEGGGS